MTTEWEKKGCSSCRQLWETGKRPMELSVNYDLHSRLHQCSECGAYWEQFERYADIIEKYEAQKIYPEAFKKGADS